MTKRQISDIKFLDSNSDSFNEWEKDFIIDLVDKDPTYILTDRQYERVLILIDKV